MEGLIDHGSKATVYDGTNSASTLLNARKTKAGSVDTLVMDDFANEDDDGQEDEASGDDYREGQHDSVVVRRGRGTKRVS
jgi:hypothetical protein